MKNTDSVVDKFAKTLAQKAMPISQSKDINWIGHLVSVLHAKYPPWL